MARPPEDDKQGWYKSLQWKKAKVDEEGAKGPQVSYSHRGQRLKHTSVEEQVGQQKITHQEREGEARQNEQRQVEAAPVDGDDQRPKEKVTPRLDQIDEKECAELEGESARPATCDTGTAMTQDAAKMGEYTQADVMFYLVGKIHGEQFENESKEIIKGAG